MSEKITNQVMDLGHDYDLINKRISNYLAWQESEEGIKLGSPRINEAHKEMLFNKWDAQIKKAEQVVEEVATVVNNVIDCVNENLHRENLISGNTSGFIPKEQHLQTSWRQKAKERADSIKKLMKLNWDSYWKYLVKMHNQCMTLMCLTNSAEKIAPTLSDSIFVGKLNLEVGQPTLLKPMWNAWDHIEQIHR